MELANPWMLAVYVIAMIAVCWHFAYGVWLFAAKWGITPGETARRRFGYVCVAFGVLLAGMGLASIWAFVGPKYPNAPETCQLVSDSGSGVGACPAVRRWSRNQMPTSVKPTELLN